MTRATVPIPTPAPGPGSSSGPSSGPAGIDGMRTGTRPVRHGPVLAVTCLALGTVVAAMASLNVALPSIARETHAGLTQLTWIIDAYSLVFASLLLPGGALGDRFGRRRTLLIGLALFGIASAAAVFTATPAVLIAIRCVLGLGGALVMPATLSTITSTFPREQRARGVSVWAAVAGASAIVGVLTTGALLTEWSWRSAFLLNVVLAAAAIAGTLVVVPESADPHAPHVDVVGALISVIGLCALVYSVIEAPERGWASPATLGGLGGGVAVMAVFVAWELRKRDPLLDPRLFKNPAFAAGTASITLQFFAFFGFIFVIMQYLQLVRGDKPLLAAVSVLPMAGGLIPASRLAPRASEKAGARACCALGLTLAALALAWLAHMNGTTAYWQLAVGLVPLGAGMGLAMTPATTAVTDALPPALQGVGSAVNDLSREVGGALGIAVLGSVLSAVYRANLPLPGAPAAAANAARSSLAVAAAMGGQVRAQAQHAFLNGMHAALLSAAAAALCGALVVSVLLRRRAAGTGE